MPAKAGIQGSKHLASRSWPPAFAEVTNEGRKHLSGPSDWGAVPYSAAAASGAASGSMPSARM
jgi:hypothetical protein